MYYFFIRIRGTSLPGAFILGRDSEGIFFVSGTAFTRFSFSLGLLWLSLSSFSVNFDEFNDSMGGFPALNGSFNGAFSE